MFESPRSGGIPQPIPKAVADNYATALYVGDPVALVADGTVARAAAGAAVFGVITSILQMKNSASVLVRNGKYIPANTRWTAHEDRTMVNIIPASTAYFVADADEGSTITTLAAAMDVEGENADHVFGTADAGLGLSGCALDISTNVVTGTLVWRIVRVFAQPGNDVLLSRARYVVSCNIPQDNAPGAALGV